METAATEIDDAESDAVPCVRSRSLIYTALLRVAAAATTAAATATITLSTRALPAARYDVDATLDDIFL